MQIIRNLLSRLTMVESGKAIYDPIKKKNYYIIGQIIILMNILQEIDLEQEQK